MLPVHNHSQYSALDGYSSPNEIADRIEELGLPGAFLTDHGTVAGLQAFREAMTWKDKRKKVKRDLFIGYGMEAYQAEHGRENHTVPGTYNEYFKMGQDQFHLVLLAKNKEGYLNLLRISDEANRTGFYYKPRVDWDLLKQYREGIIATSACLGSLINQKLIEGDETPVDMMMRTFGDDFLIEIHTYSTDFQAEVNEHLISIARDRGIRMVYANDAHYAYPDEYEIHEAMLCAQYGENIDDVKGRKNKDTGVFEVGLPDSPTYHHPQCLYIMGEDDVREHLSYLPDDVVDEAISTSDWLMETCNFIVDPPSLHLPKFKLGKKEVNSADFLQTLVVEGLESKFDEITDEIISRVEYEYEAIVDAGLADYFLIVWDYISWAKKQGIMVGPGRGSVGGSILAYALGITNIDPLKYGLQFERFWNPGRTDGLPDIDVDFEKSSRQEIIEYVKKKYGENRVLPIGNHIFMRPKSAIDKAGMVLYEKPPYGLMKTVNKIIESTDDAGAVMTWDDMMEEVGEELDGYMKSEPELFALAEGLSGRLQNYGVHASAVVISDVDLPEHLPSRMASDSEKKKVLVTQAEMKQVEKEGFPKFDFLGLRNLDTVMRTAILSGEFGEDSREARKRINKHFWELDLNSLEEDYWRMIDDGHTLGLFQIDESSSPRRIGKRLHPRNVEDLAFIVALNRPGPLRGGVVDRFLERRSGEEQVTYPHEILIDILGPTYGDFLYQEQVIDFFKAIGYSLSDADHIRKILGKKLVDEMQDEFPIYLERATQHMSEPRAMAIWESIEDFSKYSFNKAHAVGYGMILAWTLYAKAKWPTEFIMASIETNPKKVGSYINEARRIGVQVLPPDATRSDVFISKIEGEILYGLRDIKGIGDKTAQWVVDNRPYKSPEQFLEKQQAAEKPACNLGHFKKMMEAGAFDTFGYRLASCERCDGTGKMKVEGLRLREVCDQCKDGWNKIDMPDMEERVQFEEQYLGIALTDAYAELVEKYKEEIDALDDIGLAMQEDPSEIEVPGIIKSVRKTKTRADANPRYANRDMAHVTISWEGEDVTFVAFPDDYDAFHFVLKENVLCRFKLKTTKKGPQLKKAFRLI